MLEKRILRIRAPKKQKIERFGSYQQMTTIVESCSQLKPGWQSEEHACT